MYDDCPPPNYDNSLGLENRKEFHYINTENYLEVLESVKKVCKEHDIVSYEDFVSIFFDNFDMVKQNDRDKELEENFKNVYKNENDEDDDLHVNSA